MQGIPAPLVPFLPHLRHSTEAALVREDKRAATLATNLAYCLQTMFADYAGALPLIEHAQAIREKVLGSEHSLTALTLNNLAELLRTQGDYAGARPLYERSLAIREQVLGPQHPDTASSLNNLAWLCYDEGLFSEAADLMRRALAIWETVLGPNHPHTQSARQSLEAIEARMQGDG
jgi:tetratricopeptide (TPR) repeat protein